MCETFNNSCHKLSDFPLTLLQLKLPPKHSVIMCSVWVSHPNTSARCKYSPTSASITTHHKSPLLLYHLCVTAHCSSKSVRNNVSGVRFLHKQVGLAPEVLDSLPVACQLRSVDLSMCTSHTGGSPELLHSLCLLTISLGYWGQP